MLPVVLSTWVPKQGAVGVLAVCAVGGIKVGDAVTLVFPDTSTNAPLSGQRGVVEALPGGEYPDRYVVFVATTADSDQRRLAMKREHLEFFARGL